MATLTIRGLDDETKVRLRVQAARHGRSMEAEVRDILDRAVTPSLPSRGLGSRIHADFMAATGGVELALPSRRSTPRAAVFEA
jgi:antitoxin FitA